MKKIKFFILAFALAGCTVSKVETFTEALDPVPLSQSEIKAWDGVSGGLNAMWGSADLAYSRSLVPENLSESLTLAGWRGEKVSAQLLLWSAEDLKSVECIISDFKSYTRLLKTLVLVKSVNCVRKTSYSHCSRLVYKPCYISLSCK